MALAHGRPIGVFRGPLVRVTNGVNALFHILLRERLKDSERQLRFIFDSGYLTNNSSHILLMLV